MIHRLLALGLFTSLLLSLAQTATAADKPLNFVVILVDDLGWMDLTCQGSTYYETPNIDRIANEGVRFTNGYAACAVCSPTRSAVQTGRDPGRLFVTDWIRSRFQGGKIPADKVNPSGSWKAGGKGRLSVPNNALWMESSEITLAEVLEPWTSCYIGKWHLGADEWYPQKQGYDFNFGGCDYGQPPSYFDPFNQPKAKHEMIRKGIPGLPGREKGEYLTDREGDEAVNFLKANHTKPFFLMYAPYAVHTPIQAKAELTAKYEAKNTDTPDEYQKNAKYAAMVESLDDAVGGILTALDEHGVADQTVVVFTSDNGGLDNGDKPTNNHPLRSGKGYAFEGGVRVPWLVRWPGVTQPGTTSDVPISSVDLFPTIAAAAGLEFTHEIDGLDLRPALEGGTLKRDSLFWHFPHYRHNPGPYSMIRKGDLKLIKWWAGPKYDLYDLSTDLGETENLAESHPEKVQLLDAELMAHLQSIGAKIPREAAAK